MTNSELSDRRLAALASLLLLSALGVALVLVRAAYTMHLEGLGLVWNLFLAWVPFGLALTVYDGYRRGSRSLLLVAGGVLWLLFFPNAPYIVTDFKHLEAWGGAPVWYDVVLLTTFAWSGLVLGFLSLYLVQAVARQAVGAANAWFGAVGVLALSSFGIYLGRFERWNSWDAFVRPRVVLANALDGLVEGPRPLAVTLLFTAFLTTAYLVFYAFFRLAQIERG
jgi:uncharacterized membrane protein